MSEWQKVVQVRRFFWMSRTSDLYVQIRKNSEKKERTKDQKWLKRENLEPAKCWNLDQIPIEAWTTRRISLKKKKRKMIDFMADPVPSSPLAIIVSFDYKQNQHICNRLMCVHAVHSVCAVRTSVKIKKRRIIQLLNYALIFKNNNNTLKTFVLPV